MFLWLIVRSHEKRSLASAAAAGFVVGLAVLARPNLVLVGPAVCLLLLVYAASPAQRRLLIPSIFAVMFLLAISLMAMRNYAVAGQVSIQAITWTGDWMAPNLQGAGVPTLEASIGSVLATADYYARRALFTIGFGPVLVPEYRIRPHWLLMWAGFFVFAGLAAARRQLEFWQALTMLYIVLYLGPLIAVAVIETYGFRMIVPAVPVVLLLAVKAGELFWQTSRKQHGSLAAPANAA
jgi:nitrate reductase NapE component